MTSENVPPTADLQEIENGSAQAWANLTDAQRSTMASWGLGATPDATDSKPATPEASVAAEITDATLTAEQRTAAEAALQPPTRPEGYRIPDAPPGMERLAPEDDKMLRETFVNAGANQQEAYFVVTELYLAGKQMQELARGDSSTLERRINDAILLSGSRCAAELARTWGANYEKKMALARAGAAFLADGRPAIAHAFFETPFGNSVPVIRLLADWAERRRGKD